MSGILGAFRGSEKAKFWGVADIFPGHGPIHRRAMVAVDKRVQSSFETAIVVSLRDMDLLRISVNNENLPLSPEGPCGF